MLQQLMLLLDSSRPTSLSSGSEEDAEELGACGTDQQPNISESSSAGFQMK